MADTKHSRRAFLTSLACFAAAAQGQMIGLGMSIPSAHGAGSGGPTLATATAPMVQFAQAGQIFQTDTLTGGGQGVGQGAIPLQLGAGTTPGTIYVRVSSGGTTRGDYQAQFQVTITTAGAQTINIPGIDAGKRWLQIDVLDVGGWQNGTTLIGMGDLTLISGQSLGVYYVFLNDVAWSDATVIAANNGSNLATDPNLQYTRIFATSEAASTITGVTWGIPGTGSYLSSGAAKYLTAMVAQTGRLQGMVGHVSSGSTQAYWQWNVGPGYAQLVRVINATGGKYRLQIWWQGHADAEGSVSSAQYARDMDRREFGTNGYASLNSYPRANVIRLVQTVPNIANGVGYYGPVRSVLGVRKGAKDWCTAKNDGVNKNGIYVEMPALKLTADPHPGTIGCIEASTCFVRAAINDNDGPVLLTAARDPANPNDMILTFDRTVVATGSWWKRAAVYIAGSTQNLVSCASGVPINSTQLRVTLTAPTGGAWAVGDSFDVIMGAPWDGDVDHDPSPNMIRDTRTDTIDPANGRPFKTAVVAVNAPQISAGSPTPTANYPVAYKAPSSLNDLTMTNAAYDTVEHLAGFGKPLIGGYGTTLVNQVNLLHGQVSFQMGVTIFARIRTPSAAVATGNRYLFNVNGGGILLKSGGTISVIGSAFTLNATVQSGTLLANTVYWIAMTVSPTGALSLYVYDCINTGIGVKLTTGGTTSTPFAEPQGKYLAGSASAGSDPFNGTTGCSIMEIGVFDSDTIFTGGNGSFVPPAAPFAGNEAHLVFYDRPVLERDPTLTGIQHDLVLAA